MESPSESEVAAQATRGARPVDRFRAVLEGARAAAPAGRERLLILTHRGPDPDALGACQGVAHLVREAFAMPVDVATVGEIHRAENLAMVRALDLDFGVYERVDPAAYFGAVLVDTQPDFGHTLVPTDIPLLGVFDHHVPPGQDEGASRPGVAHADVRLGIGATATIVYEYLRDAGCALDPVTATALFCGVRYDTADLSRNASPLDEEAYYATFRQADRERITRIHHPPLPRVYYSELHTALSVAKQYGPLVLCLLGKVSHPEFVAEMADFFLRMKSASWVVVGGAAEKEGEYVLSLRTDYAFGNAYPLMERVLGGEGSFGGHGHIAGGRIPLEDLGESTIASVERGLRERALAILGQGEPDEMPPKGRSLARNGG